jgi:hypothetical protein
VVVRWGGGELLLLLLLLLLDLDQFYRRREKSAGETKKKAPISFRVLVGTGRAGGLAYARGGETATRAGEEDLT